MPDALGYRAKFAVLIPSTNTIVQPEFDAMRPQGVTNHISRIAVPNLALDSNEAFASFMALVDGALKTAVEGVMTCEPTHMVMGMSSETFWGGAAGSAELKKRVEDWCKLPVIMGSEAADAALKRYRARRLGVITPYAPIGDEQVVRFFQDMGYEVLRIIGLRRESPVAIAHTPPAMLWGALESVNQSDVDVILQCGTNLAMAAIAAEAEARLKKPVLAINSVIYWHALRSAGITDPVNGFGSLLAE